MTDRTEQTEVLLNLYHFKENDIGLPIDSFTNGDYDRYIDALIRAISECMQKIRHCTQDSPYMRTKKIKNIFRRCLH